MSNLKSLSEKLHTAGYSITKARELVFVALEGQEPLSMAELVKRVDKNVDRASVYRTIKLFERLGIIQKLQIGWKYKLELSDEFHDHHHHIACIKCGSIVAVEENPQLEAAITILAKQSGFSVLTHQFELRGICKDCQQARKHETPTV